MTAGLAAGRAQVADSALVGIDADCSEAAAPASSVLPSEAFRISQKPSEALDAQLDVQLDSLVRPEQPIVVLIDRGTASSAELFAAALHDNGRAVLVGEHSFGKGLIQRVFPMPNGGALKLTIGEYLRPNRAKVEVGVGLQPDVRCVATPAEQHEDACVDVAASMARGGRPLGRQPGSRQPGPPPPA